MRPDVACVRAFVLLHRLAHPAFEVVALRRFPGRPGKRHPDSREQAALDFAKTVVEKKGIVSDEDVARVRASGYDDGDVAEIVANVVFTIYTNYFNNVAGTEIDFPPVPDVSAAAVAV